MPRAVSLQIVSKLRPNIHSQKAQFFSLATARKIKADKQQSLMHTHESKKILK